MKILYCIPLLYLSVLASDNDKPLYFVITQFFHGFGHEDTYRQEFPVSKPTADRLNTFIGERKKSFDIHKDIWLGLWPCEFNKTTSNSWIIKGYATLTDIKEISEIVPEAQICFSQLEKRLNDIDEFNKKKSSQ